MFSLSTSFNTRSHPPPPPPPRSASTSNTLLRTIADSSSNMKCNKLSRFSAKSAVVASLVIAFLAHKVSGFAPAVVSMSSPPRAHQFAQPLASSTLEEPATMSTMNEQEELRTQLEAAQAEVRLLEAALERTVTHLEHELVASKEALGAAQRQLDDAHAEMERLRQSNPKWQELAAQGGRKVRQRVTQVRQGASKMAVLMKQ